MVRGNAAAVSHQLPSRGRDPDIPDPLPVDDVHDPQPGRVYLSPRGDRVAPLHVGRGRHDAAGTQHEVAGPAERMLTIVAGAVAADCDERPEPLVDRILHLAHERLYFVPDFLRLQP